MNKTEKCPKCQQDSLFYYLTTGEWLCRNCYFRQSFNTYMSEVSFSVDKMGHSSPAVAKVMFLGRGSENHIDIDDDTISSNQCQFSFDPKTRHFILRNVGSDIFINGRKVQQESVILKENDVISIGFLTLFFQQNDIRITNVDEKRTTEKFIKLENQEIERIIPKPISYQDIVIDVADISVDNIILSKGKDRLLNRLSFTVKKGSFMAVVGPSGCGKTSLIRVLCGLEREYLGLVKFRDVDLRKCIAPYKTRLGYVSQRNVLYDNLTVEESLDYSIQLRLSKELTIMRRKERIYQMLKTIDMDYSRTKLTKVLSGGEQRRLSLAIELLSNPDIIFLDEVTSGLDPYAETKIMELLERIAKSGITIILITHATKNLSRCDKVLFLSKGEQRYFGTPEDSLRSFKVPDFDKIYEVI